MAVKVYGHSDDLVEFRGDFKDEQSPRNFIFYVTFDNGVVLRGIYDGVWHFHPVEKPELVTFEYQVPLDYDDLSNDPYSDVVLVQGAKKAWVSERPLKPLEKRPLITLAELEQAEHLFRDDAESVAEEYPKFAQFYEKLLATVKQLYAEKK